MMNKILVLGSVLLFASGCDNAEPNLIPLTTNYIYTYDVTTVHADNEKVLREIIEVDGPFDHEGRKVFIRNHGTFYQDILHEDMTGVHVIGDIGSRGIREFDRDRLLLPNVVALGDTWESTINSRLLKWRKKSLEHADESLKKTLDIKYECVDTSASVAVPAGRFDNVRVVKGTASGIFELGAVKDRNRIKIEVTKWYAPGVGLIKAHTKETSDSGLLIPGQETKLLNNYHL